MVESESNTEITYTLSEREIDLLTIALDALPPEFDDPDYWDDRRAHNDFCLLRATLARLIDG
ncbi:MAG: hypothetical protein ACTHMJ_01750 [Thermomicrobiales bacterium]